METNITSEKPIVLLCKNCVHCVPFEISDLKHPARYEYARCRIAVQAPATVSLVTGEDIPADLAFCDNERQYNLHGCGPSGARYWPKIEDDTKE